MPIKIIADTRELLVDIFFAIIIAVGIGNFVEHFLLDDIFKEPKPIADIYKLTEKFLEPGVLTDTLFFFAAYFWVLSHWIFYHDLIEKYPYYNWWKFFVDITLFSAMFVIINISYSVYTPDVGANHIYKINNAIASLFILLLTIWYLLSLLWHLSDLKLRPLKRYVRPHIARIVTYAVLLALLYVPASKEQTIVHQNIVMICVILAMIGWNIERLHKFLEKDWREYKLFHIFGIDASVSGSGILHLERFPMRKISKRRTDKKDMDIIRLYIDHKEPIEIFPETITSLKIDERVGDLTIDITYKPEGSTEQVIGLDLDDRTIKGVFKELNQLHMNNKRKRYWHRSIGYQRDIENLESHHRQIYLYISEVIRTTIGNIKAILQRGQT